MMVLLVISFVGIIRSYKSTRILRNCIDVIYPVITLFYPQLFKERKN